MLIATLGATKVDKKQIYKIDNKEYSEYFSFLALQKYYNIEDKDIYIIGTKLTREVLFDKIKNFNFILVDELSIENIFEKSIKILKKDDIIDLTQSFRSISFGVMLSISYSKALQKVAKDIFYASILSSDCNPTKEVCKFEFISLKKYDEITDTIRVINTFCNSWYVIEDFNHYLKELKNISQKLLINDLNVENELKSIKATIKNLIKEQPFLYEHLKILKKEIFTIKNILSLEEYKKYFEISKLYFNKGLYLQTLTMLYEAILAYLDYIALENYCYKQNKKIYKNSSVYRWRNCLKSNLVFNCNKKLFDIKNCNEFRQYLKELDSLRNGSAHVFTSSSSLDNYKNKIKSLIDFFQINLKDKNERSN